MAPPGGQSQINLFGAPEQPPQHQVNKHQAHRNQSSIFGSPEQKSPSNSTASAPSQPAAQPAPRASAAAAESSNSSITAPPKNQHPTAPDGGRASTKVMAPPGGKTSINLFG